MSEAISLQWGLINGEIVQNPRTHALHLGLMVGDGIFETLELVNGRLFARDRHLLRLHRSAQLVGLPLPSDDDLQRLIQHGVDHAPADHRRLRITVISTGSELRPMRSDEAPLVIVATGTAPESAESASVVTVPWVRNDRGRLTGVKTTSYQENLLIAQYARDAGAHEAVMANTRDQICEGSSSNVVLERVGELITPPLSSGCLAGVTRELALEWGQAAGLPIREATEDELPYSLMTNTTSAPDFALAMLGTLRGIQPVGELDGRPLPPGPLIADLRRVFRENVVAGHLLD